MGTSQVRNMDVITYTGTIFGIVVIAKNLKIIPPSHRDFHDYREKIRGVMFKTGYPSRGIVTCRVKITEGSRADTLKLFIPPEKSFDLQFGKSIIIFRNCGMIFVDRQVLGFAVNRGGRGEHYITDTCFACGIQDVQGPGNIVNRVFFRFNHRLAGCLTGSEMEKSFEALRKCLT